MFQWIGENVVTIVTVAILLAVLGLALYAVIKEKKKKTGGCTGNCATCGMGCSHGKKS